MKINKAVFLDNWKKSIGWCVLVGFMYIIFGPLEIFFSNTKEFPFILNDFIWSLILLFIIFITLFSVLLVVVFKKWFGYIICLVMGFGIASYIQYLMNGKMGLWDGQNVQDENSFINGCIWVAICVGCFLLMKLKRNIWNAVVSFCPWFIIAIQMVASLSLFFTASEEAFHREDSKYIFSGDGTYTVSGKDNIIILVLDCFSNMNIQPMLDKYPDALEGMEDFTYFDNANSIYESTYASLMNMLTGVEYDTENPYYEWADEAWSSQKAELLFGGLKKNNYKTQIFTKDLIWGEHPEYVADKVDNFRKVDVSNINVNSKKLISLLLKASTYRYVPDALKSYISVNTDEFYDTVIVEYGEATSVINRNYEYYKGLVDNGLEKDFSSNYFVLQHIRGTHPPYWLDQNGHYIEEGNLLDAARGCMLIVQNYLSQLQELDIYENATIIIMADHGNQQTCDGVQPIFFVKRAYENHEEMQVSSAPISYEDFISTILDILDENGTETGQSFFDLDESENRERVMYIRKWDERYPAVERSISGGESSINVLYKYIYSGNALDLKEAEKMGPDKIIPLSEYPN